MWIEVSKKWFSKELDELKKLIVTTISGETYYFNFEKQKEEVISIDGYKLRLVELRILDEIDRKEKRPSFEHGALPCKYIGNMLGGAICAGFPELGQSMYISHLNGVWKPEDRLIPKKIEYEEKTEEEMLNERKKSTQL